MFVNEVSFEARGKSSDGLEIIVTEIASATSDISYEDAWIKAHALAKEKADATLVEKMKLLTGEVKEKLVYLKGEKGCHGSRGPQGVPGASSSDPTSYSGYQGKLSKEIADELIALIAQAESLPKKPTLGDLNDMANIFSTFGSTISPSSVVKFKQNVLSVEVFQQEMDSLATKIIESDIAVPLLSCGILKISLANTTIGSRYTPADSRDAIITVAYLTAIYG